MHGVATSFGRPCPPPELGRMDDALPAAFAKLPEGVAKAGRRAHLAVFPATRRPVAGRVQRRQHLAVEPRGLFEYGFHRLRRGVPETGQRGDICQSGQFLDDKHHVLGGCGIAHLVPRFLRCSARRPTGPLRCDIDESIVRSRRADSITRIGPFTDKSCRIAPCAPAAGRQAAAVAGSASRWPGMAVRAAPLRAAGGRRWACCPSSGGMRGGRRWDCRSRRRRRSRRWSPRTASGAGWRCRAALRP
ncbi:hypothetical protein EPAKOI_001567 [Cupriavidus sp. H18C2]